MEGVLRQLQGADAATAPDLSARDWAGLLWSAARCRERPSPALLAGAAEAAAAAAEAAGGLQASDAARLFWAAATLRWADPRFLEGAVAASRGLLPDASAQDLSNIVWASAVLRQGLEAWAEEAARAFADLRAGTPGDAQAVANVLLGLAKVREGGRDYSDEGGEARHALACRLAPIATAALPGATPQGTANMLWAYAKLSAHGQAEAAFVRAAADRMAALLPEAETQNVANAAWAAARLSSAVAAAAADGGGSGLEPLFCAIAAHLHERVKSPSGQKSRRWAACSLRHVSMLCWAFAKALPAHQATRQALRDAAAQLPDLTDQGTVKAQEHSNVLWAWAEGVDAWAPAERPATVLKRVIGTMCNPALKLEDDSPLACVATAGALAKLHGLVGAESRSLIERWMDRVSQSCCKMGLDQLKGSEIAALLRAMVACRALHGRLLNVAFRELQGERRAAALQPFERALAVEAVAFLRPARLPPDFVDFLGSAVPRFLEFPPRDLATFMWALLRVAHASGQDFDAVLVACTRALAQHLRREPQQHQPQQLPRQPGLAPSLLRQRGAGGGADAWPGGLTSREWMWVMSAAAPVKLSAHGPEAPQWLLDSFVQPWVAWLDALVEEIRAEVLALAGRPRSPAAEECALLRYRSLLQRHGLDSLGPRWTPLALKGLGIRYAGTNVPEAARDAVAKQREQGGAYGRFGVAAWLRAELEPESTSSTPEFAAQAVAPEPRVFEHCAWSSDPVAEDSAEGPCSEDGCPAHGGRGGPARAKVVEDEEDEEDEGGSQAPGGEQEEQAADPGVRSGLVSVPLGGRHRYRHAEFQVLSRLLPELADGQQGKVFLYVDRTPCLSCVGALAQLRRRWPGVSWEVAFAWGPAEPLEPDPCEPPNPVPHVASELEAAVRQVLEAHPGGVAPITTVGADPLVGKLWGQLCATGVRPSGKQPGKKREWQDKLKYFLSHRPSAFRVEDPGPGGAASKVRLLTPPLAAGPEEAPDGTEAQTRCDLFCKLDAEVEKAIVGLLRKGRGRRDGDGYVPIEEVGGEEEVARAWRQCRHDATDRLAYYLKHSEDFEVWSPPRAREPGAEGGSGGGGGPSEEEGAASGAAGGGAAAAVGLGSRGGPLDVRSWVRIKL